MNYPKKRKWNEISLVSLGLELFKMRENKEATISRRKRPRGHHSPGLKDHVTQCWADERRCWELGPEEQPLPLPLHASEHSLTGAFLQKASLALPPPPCSLPAHCWPRLRSSCQNTPMWGMRSNQGILCHWDVSQSWHFPSCPLWGQVRHRIWHLNKDTSLGFTWVSLDRLAAQSTPAASLRRAFTGGSWEPWEYGAQINFDQRGYYRLGSCPAHRTSSSSMSWHPFSYNGPSPWAPRLAG